MSTRASSINANARAGHTARNTNQQAPDKPNYPPPSRRSSKTTPIWLTLSPQRIVDHFIGQHVEVPSLTIHCIIVNDQVQDGSGRRTLAHRTTDLEAIAPVYMMSPQYKKPDWGVPTLQLPVRKNLIDVDGLGVEMSGVVQPGVKMMTLFQLSPLIAKRLTGLERLEVSGVEVDYENLVVGANIPQEDDDEDEDAADMMESPSLKVKVTMAYRPKIRENNEVLLGNRLFEHGFDPEDSEAASKWEMKWMSDAEFAGVISRVRPGRSHAGMIALRAD